jgi:hypothetical protein
VIWLLGSLPFLCTTFRCVLGCSVVLALAIPFFGGGTVISVDWSGFEYGMAIGMFCFIAPWMLMIPIRVFRGAVDNREDIQ